MSAAIIASNECIDVLIKGIKNEWYFFTKTVANDLCQ